jgi:3-oxoacid CoA-transferase
MNYPVNAGKIPVSAIPGSSYFDSASSFGMIRGGHIDVAVMGGLQVDEFANLANWKIPGKSLLGIGGAMDLALGAKKLIIIMMHTDKKGFSKIVKKCTLPITATKCVSTIITDLGKFKFEGNKLLLTEMMPGTTLDEVRAKTDAEFQSLV